MVSRSQSNKNRYDPDAAGAFWTGRLESTDPLAAVLTYNAHPALNRAYDRWERELLRSLLPAAARKWNALDIGCGIGRISVELAKAGAEVTAVDVSEKMLAACRARARRNRVSHRVTTVHGSADHLPVKSRHDVITCFGLLEHLPPNVRTGCLREALSRLKARGRMYVVVNNHRNVFLKSHYPLKQQRADGYFVGLVGLPWLRQYCTRRGFRATVRGANPFYALAHYHLLPHRKQLKLSEREVAHLCALAGSLDLAHPLDGPVPDRFASHYFVEIKKIAG